MYYFGAQNFVPIRKLLLQSNKHSVLDGYMYLISVKRINAG